MLGLENLSTPTRLAIVIAITSLILLLVLWAMIRRKQSPIEEYQPTDLTKDPVEPAEKGTSAPVGAEDNTKQAELTNSITQEMTDAKGVAFDLPLFMDEALSEKIDIVSRLSEIIAKTAPSREIKNYGERILTAASDTSLLIDNARFLNNPNLFETAPQPATVNFTDLIRSKKRKWSSLLSKEGVQFTCFLDENVPNCLFLDPLPLKKAINSLLTNSRNLTQNGRIHLHVTGENKEEYDWTIKIIVADTGHGFDPVFKTQINSPSSDMKPQNLEQANILAARGFSKQLKGQLHLKSVLGKGTEASISFPSRVAMVMSAKESSSDVTTKPISAGSLSGKRVLIIEDDKHSQEVLSTFLRPEGCRIDCIDDGQYALETLAKTRYDLVLMDVRMNGLDGIKTTRAIRRSQTHFKDVPIIAITADTSAETNAKCMMAGVDLFLTKPVGAKGLFDAIRFVMDLGADIRLATKEATG